MLNGRVNITVARKAKKKSCEFFFQQDQRSIFQLYISLGQISINIVSGRHSTKQDYEL